MGVRGEVFSTKVILQNRTYFFNVKENRLGDLYLNIVESKNRAEGGFERQSVILFAEDLQEFLGGFDESLRVLEKAYREKRRGPPKSAARPAGRDYEQDDKPGESYPARRNERTEKREKNFKPRSRPEPAERVYGRTGRVPAPRDKFREGPKGKKNDRSASRERPEDRGRGEYKSRKDEDPRKKRVIVRKKN